MTSLRIGKRDLLPLAAVDDTLLVVPLAEPVGPSAAIEVEIEFVSTLPKVFARTGYVGDFHAVAQWFPKIGVWDCGGGACRWRAHQFHGRTEFFADYGTYDVEIDVPAQMVVGASGVLQEERPVTGGRKVLRYRPRYLAVVGFTAYRIAFANRKAVGGRQPEPIGSTVVWVLPNPSGLNAHHQPAVLTKLFRELRLAV